MVLDGEDPAEATAGHAPSVRRQMALLLALAVAPAMLLAVAFAARTYSVQTDRVDRVFVQEAATTSRAVRDLLISARASLETLADVARIDDLPQEECDAALARTTAGQPAFSLAVVIGPDGAIQCTSEPGLGSLGIVSGAHVAELTQGARVRLDFVELSGAHSGPAAAASLPLRDGARREGAVIMFAPVAALRRAASVPPPGEGPGARLRVAILDSSGMVMLDQSYAERGWLPPAEAIQPLLEGRRRGPAEAMAAGGETWLYAVAPLWPGRAWMLVGAERDALYAGALRGAAAPIIAPFLMLPVAVAMAYFALNRLVVRHVVYLARLTRAYGAGRLRLRPRGLANAPRELAMLADDLARMAERLEDRQEALVRAAENNRFLLREVHHRVKNNLQMIVSLLNLQAGRARTDGEREGLDRIRARVMAVAAVHGAIYASDAMDRVPLDALIRRVAEAQGGMPAGAGRPRLSLDLDPVEDTPERATPLALLANEALTNAIKYAAAEDGNPPRIEVALRARPEGGYAFSVANDVTAEVDATDEGAVGARLIDGFARQIGASLQRRTLDGRFRLDLVAPPPPETEAEPAPEGPRNA